MIEPKQLVAWYMTGPERDHYTCRNQKCGKKYKAAAGHGYDNLYKHLAKCIGPDFRHKYQEMHTKTAPTLATHGFTNQEDNDRYKTIELVIQRDMPLSEVEHPLTREALKYGKVDRTTLTQTILSMKPVIESGIAAVLPQHFALMIDGWSEGVMHYVAIICCFTVEGTYNEVLLTMSPLPDQTSLNAAQHVLLVQETLAQYNRSIENVVAIIGDNCRVNSKTAKELGIPLIGCASHKFALAVNAWIAAQPGLDAALDKVNKVMVKLRTIKNAAALRLATQLCAVPANKTRWSSKFEMLKRYLRIIGDLTDIASVAPFLPNAADNLVLKAAVAHLNNFWSVTKNIQAKEINMLHIREDFDLICTSYPELSPYLALGAKLTNDTIFESAVVKILGKNENLLSDQETARMSKYELVDGVADAATPTSTTAPSFYEQIQAQKKRRLSKAKYIDFSFLVATSNSVERLFSSCKIVLDPRRKSMSPATFEAIMFLKFNRHYWNVNTVAYAMQHPVVSATQVPNDDFDEY